MEITNSLLESFNSPEFTEKYDRQIALEEHMHSLGVDRFWHSQRRAVERGKETDTRTVRRLMDHALLEMVQAIESFLAEAQSGKAGRKSLAAEYLAKIEPEVSALVTVRSVLDSITQQREFTKMAICVARHIEDELSYRKFKEADPKLFKVLIDREKRANGNCYERQRKSMLVNMRNRQIEREFWSERTKLLVGAKLIELMMLSTGLIEKTSYNKSKNRTVVAISATKEAMSWIREENNRAQYLTPTLLPTIIPPKPWESPYGGGYWSGIVCRTVLVKKLPKTYLEELYHMDLSKFYDAINAIQNTAWRINEDVLEVMKHLWDIGSSLGGIPEADPVDLPVKPDFIEAGLPKEAWSEDQMETFKSWKRKASDVHAYNSRLCSLRLQFAKVMTIAEQFKEEEEIFFPHQVDFRGRCYAMPMFLNPQGADPAKGLLQFAHAVPIETDEAASWLAIHGANVYGEDKISLEDRVRWVEAHEAEILAVAADPMANFFWTEADKPWQFLAFCFDWAGFVQEGFGYHSHLSVQMDGSCNGLQNFSAMLRDPIGGAAVNLTPSDLPSDIYAQVAEKVKEIVGKDAQGTGELSVLAQGWLKVGITRKVCKRPVMTLAYGATAFGFREQVYEDTVKELRRSKDPEKYPWEGAGHDAAAYLGRVIWEAVGEVVVAAVSAMGWLQEAAKVASKYNMPLVWTVDDGFTVYQAYRKLNVKKIKLSFNSQRLMIRVSEGNLPDLNKSKQVSSISPNWVHAMDAAHMRATVRSCFKSGLRSFSLIHDSYGTHAGNAGCLAQALREEFILLYQKDILAEFRQDLITRLPEDVGLKTLPQKGTLDLDQVRTSRYFFA